MSHRIFVNKLNQRYRAITQNSKGLEYGLGVTSVLTQAEEEELKINELYYTADDLREKRRKLQIILDSFTDPKFFGDGAVKIDKVQKYLTDIQLEAEKVRANNNAITAAQLAAGGYAAAAAAGTAAAVASTTGAVVVASGVPALGIPATVVSTGGLSVGATAAAFLPIAGFVAAAAVISNIAKSFRQAGREDNAAPWKMTRADFPNITAQAIQNSPSRRSIERLYDDRGGFKTFNVSTQEAIALLVREALADALFCTSNQNGTATTPSSHPGPGGNGTAEQWVSKDELARHFPFTFVNTGADLNERTYVNALVYLLNYITLIDNALDLQDSSLSRTPDLETATINVPIRISLSTANINLFDALKTAARNVVEEKVLTFFDESRELKTILNFGSDRQYVAQSWRISPSDPKKNKIQFKLIKSLERNIIPSTTAFISREVAKSVVDMVEFQLAPSPDQTPYLRPMNNTVGISRNKTATVSNVTLTDLQLITGSVGVVSNNVVTYEDKVFRKWLTTDFNSSELNIDFSDYKNFVHFGSAYKRLETFAQKLLTIQELDTYTTASVSSSNVGASLKAIEKEYIIRNFDPYEKFLYFESGSSIAYSGSAYYADDDVEYNITGSWPKDENNNPYSPYHPVVSASWYPLQSAIAQRYDEFNPNRLALHLPSYIQEDVNSKEFITLVYMVGHLFDNIKVYIDQFPNIYSTNPAPLEELTMDQVYEVAKSFGVNLPNAYSLDKLQQFVLESADGNGRSLVAETWKRFLHSMIFLNKIKGSKSSTDSLLNLYGINSPVVQVKETSYAEPGNYVMSDELTYGLQFSSSLNNSIKIPFVSSSITAKTLQLRFIPTKRENSSVVVGDSKWAIDIIPHPSASSTSYFLTSSTNNQFGVTTANKLEYGKIHVVSGSGRQIIATSSYFPLFGNDYTNIMLRSQSGDLTVIQTDGDQILFQESMSVNLNVVWPNTQFIYVGGSGSISVGGFNGVVDEVQVWGENISDDNFVRHTYDPGAYYGASYTSSYNNLYVQLSFNQPYSSITQSAYNESPYSNISTVSNLPAIGFLTSSYRRVSRTIRQFTPLAGTSIYTDKKVVVAPPPTFDSRFVDVSGSRMLRRGLSIKTVDNKVYTQGKNIVSFAVSPTDFTNQVIMRSMGTVDVNNIIGSPRYSQNTQYSNLNEINYRFKQYFNKTVNPNEYTRFFKNLIQSPVEVTKTMVPARTKLLEGIVIESPILNRNKTYLLRSTKVDGTDTKELLSYVSGSGSLDVGAYPFDVTYDINTQRTLTSDILPLSGTLDMMGEIKVIPSTKSSLLPSYRRVLQYLSTSSIFINSGSLVTSSLFDEGSSFAYVEASRIYAGPTEGLSSPYPRNAFVGIPSSGSIALRLPSEDNTLTPIYDIPPRSDFSDIGTTTYFHKTNGIYSYDIYTLYKTPYLVKLDTQLSSTLDRLYAKITLLDTTTPPEVERQTSIIAAATYPANSSINGTISIANIASILGITAPTGLRIRLYRDATALTQDANRSFTESPALNSGVLFDAVLDGTSDVFPYTLIQTVNSTVYYAITNTTANDINTQIKIYYFAYEPRNSLPLGYLPRHYKFSRENSIGLKRRNYLGTNGTDEIPPPGCPWFPCPPFGVKVSGEYTLYATSTNPTLPTTENISFGGGGYLGAEQ